MCEAFRESATVEAWLKEHPEVAFVSRDRGKEFTKAATVGAPQARAAWWIVSMWSKTSPRCSRRSLGTVVRKFARERLLCLSWRRQEKSPLARFPRQPHGSSALLLT